MTLMPEVGQYILGDITRVRCAEPDPFEGWQAFTEKLSHDMRSIRIGDELVGVMGYFLLSKETADSFALVDREACAGHGRELAAAVRARTIQWMDDIGVVRAFADCASDDRVAAVFLRAIGYRRIAGGDPTRTNFVFTREQAKWQK